MPIGNCRSKCIQCLTLMCLIVRLRSKCFRPWMTPCANIRTTLASVAVHGGWYMYCRYRGGLQSRKTWYRHALCMPPMLQVGLREPPGPGWSVRARRIKQKENSPNGWLFWDAKRCRTTTWDFGEDTWALPLAVIWRVKVSIRLVATLLSWQVRGQLSDRACQPKLSACQRPNMRIA